MENEIRYKTDMILKLLHEADWIGFRKPQRVGTKANTFIRIILEDDIITEATLRTILSIGDIIGCPVELRNYKNNYAVYYKVRV